MQILLVVPCQRSLEDASMDIPEICAEWGEADQWRDGAEVDVKAITPFPTFGYLDPGFHCGKFQVTPLDFDDEDKMIVVFIGFDFTTMSSMGKVVINRIEDYLIELYSLVPKTKIGFARGHFAPIGYYMVYEDCCEHTLVIDECVAYQPPQVPLVA